MFIVIFFITMLVSGKSKRSGRRCSKKKKSDKQKPINDSTHERHLFILVYRGDPTDDPEDRHTALFVTDQDINYDNLNQRSRNSMIHAIGEPGYFQVEERQNIRNPAASRSFLQAVFVETFYMSSDRGLQEWILQTRVQNDIDAYPEWNCQTFVTDALTHLLNNQLLNGDSYTNATSGMFTALDFDNNIEDDPEELVYND